MATQVKILRAADYGKFLETLLQGESRLYAPVQQGQRVSYRRITAPGEIAEGFLIPDMSAKAVVFPRIEKLLGYTKTKDDVLVEDFDPDTVPHKIVWGMRPCDAAGFEGLGAIFGWDPADPIFTLRRERTTLVGLSCPTADDFCFCTSLGGGPGNASGCDMLLTKKAGGDYIVEVVTPKGEALVAVAPALFADGDASDKEKYLAEVPVRFNQEGLKERLEGDFDTDVFDRYAMRCIGCGACAYVCPICACFDIQDETKGSTGRRVRTWDTCGAKLFTLHTSGHNPRETQGARWRQRLMHKFSYMPDRLDGVRGCVGCGRCSRRCPVDMNIAESLGQI